MKKHVSVIMLLCKTKLKGFAATLAAMAVLSVAGYKIFFAGEEDFVSGYAGLFLRIVFSAAFVCCALSCLLLGGKKSEFGYSLQRLRISEQGVYAWDCAINSVLFILLWLSEAVIVYFLARGFAGSAEYNMGPQYLIIRFYGNDFLHALIPMKETLILLRNFIFMISAGMVCAYVSLASRYRGRKNAYGWMGVPAIIIGRFPLSLGDEIIIFSVIVIGFTAASLYCALVTAHGGKGRNEDEEFVS